VDESVETLRCFNDLALKVLKHDSPMFLYSNLWEHSLRMLSNVSRIGLSDTEPS
jgi:hypothetical protein